MPARAFSRAHPWLRSPIISAAWWILVAHSLNKDNPCQPYLGGKKTYFVFASWCVRACECEREGWMDWINAGQQLWQRKTLQIAEIFICHGGVIPHLQISVILAAEDWCFRDPCARLRASARLFSSRASPDSAPVIPVRLAFAACKSLCSLFLLNIQICL